MYDFLVGIYVNSAFLAQGEAFVIITNTCFMQILRAVISSVTPCRELSVLFLIKHLYQFCSEQLVTYGLCFITPSCDTCKFGNFEGILCNIWSNCWECVFHKENV